VERHGHDHVEPLLARQGSQQKCAQRPAQRTNPAVLEEVDEVPQLAVVGAEGIRRIKPSQPEAAQRAPAFAVQRVAIQERRPAVHAEELGRKGLDPAQARGTDGNPGNLRQRLIAEPAVVGEDKRKKGGRELRDLGREPDWQDMR
jgi:hypothetical protein